jgi:hypothetical protein
MVPADSAGKMTRRDREALSRAARLRTRVARVQFKLGDRVRCSSSAGPNVRLRFGRQVGVVVVPDNEGEVGVRFGSPHAHTSAVWFLSAELESSSWTRKVGQRCSETPHSTTRQVAAP